jgi:Fe-S oxidoreductase
LSEQSKTLSELLVATELWRPPLLNGKAVLHTHCHHKVLNAEAEVEILKRMGLEVEQPTLGCCGHAGAFGYESEHYPISMQIGEQILLPKIRSTPSDTIIVADGFSCRQQIEDGSGRWAMHPAEVIALAMDSAGRPPQPIPERRYLDAAATPNKPALVAAGMGVVAVAALAAIVLARRAKA